MPPTVGPIGAPRGPQPPDRLDHPFGPMPDIELLHLENSPARGTESLQSNLIVALVKNTPVEELALHLDKNA